MIDFLGHNLAPLMFAGLAFFLLLGFPVAFSLAANGLFFAFIGFELGVLDPSLLQALPLRVYGIMYNETLLAIPFFTFMGVVLEKSGMAEDLLDTVGQVFGRIRGGLAYAVVLVGALLAATTGVVAASVMAMGLISLPIMMRYGYDQRIASGSIMASGTLAQIIPPSLVLIIIGDQLGTDIGSMYEAALLPGLLMVGMFLAYVLATSVLQPHKLPPVPRELQVDRGIKLLLRVIFVMVPPLILIFLVLGTIFLGVATPTEGGAMGAVGAVLLATLTKLSKTAFGLQRKVNRGFGETQEVGAAGISFSRGVRMITQALDSTAKLSTFVMFILIGSTVFALIFQGVHGDTWVKELLLALPGGEAGFLVFVLTVIFILGFFLDFFEIAFILLPLLKPVAETLNIDLVWFGILVGIVLQTSFLSPPFGFALFYLRSVAPDKPYRDPVTGRTIQGIATAQIYRSVTPFILLQLSVIAAVVLFPQTIAGHAPPAGEGVDLDTIEIRIGGDDAGGAGGWGGGWGTSAGWGGGGIAAPDGGAAAPASGGSLDPSGGGGGGSGGGGGATAAPTPNPVVNPFGDVAPALAATPDPVVNPFGDVAPAAAPTPGATPGATVTPGPDGTPDPTPTP